MLPGSIVRRRVPQGFGFGNLGLGVFGSWFARVPNASGLRGGIFTIPVVENYRGCREERTKSRSTVTSGPYAPLPASDFHHRRSTHRGGARQQLRDRGGARLGETLFVLSRQQLLSFIFASSAINPRRR